jgi:type IV pilus assembly protein PilN
MIKINLVSNRPKKTTSLRGSSLGSISESDVFISDDEVRKDAAKRIVIFLVPIVLIWTYGELVVPQKRDELAAKTQDYNKLVDYNKKQSASVAEIKKFKEDESLIESRIVVLNKLSKDRYKEIRVLELLQQVIPEKAWLRKVKIGQQKLILEGTALSDFEVSKFMESLTKSAFLVDVNLITSSEVITAGTSYKNFEISCSLEGQQ